MHIWQDLQTLDLEPYQYSGVNFTGVRLINPEDEALEILDKHKKEWGLDDLSQLRVEPALMYDAVQLFARAFKQLKDATRGDVKVLSCNESDRWENGLSLSNFMRSVRYKKFFNSSISNISKYQVLLSHRVIHKFVCINCNSNSKEMNTKHGNHYYI